MADPFTYTLTVDPAAIDAQGHANNVEHVRRMQATAIAAAEASNHGATLMRESSTAWAVCSHHVEYARRRLPATG